MLAGCSAQTTEQFAKLEPEIGRAQAQWEKSPEARAVPVDWTITRGLVVQRRLAGANGFDGKRIINVDIEHEEAVRFTNRDKFSISAWILSKTPAGTMVARGKDIQDAPGYSLSLHDARPRLDLIRQWPDDAMRVEAESVVALNEWQNVTMTYDGSGAAGGVRIYIGGQAQKVKVDRDNLHGSFEASEPLWIGGGSGPESRFRGQIRLVRIYRTALSPEESAVIATQTPVSTIAQTPVEKRTPGESGKIRRYFLERAAPAEIREAWRRAAEARGE